MLSRRTLLKMGPGAGLAGGGIAVAGVVGTYRFQITRHSLGLAGLTQPLRLLQLSDLHYGPYIHAQSVRAWVEAALRQQADLVVLTGDILDTQSHRKSWRSRIKQGLSRNERLLFAELKRLHAPLGVYAVWGNHDYGSVRDMAPLESGLAQIGIEVLTNRGKAVRGDLYLAGVDDLWYGQPNVETALRARPAKSACVLMCHNPDYLPKVPPKVELTLRGHTHGGQIWLPGVGSPWTPSQYGEQFRQGWFEAPVKAFVSRGLGVTGVPLRNVGAEMSLFELLPEVA